MRPSKRPLPHHLRHGGSVVTGIVDGLWDAFTLPGRVYMGEVSEDELTGEAVNFATSLIGGDSGTAGRGAVLGAGPIRRGRGRAPDLPMDPASRMARATAMGFDPNRRLYHGTAAKKDFAGFDARRFGDATGAPTARGSVDHAHPEEASYHAQVMSQRSGAGDPRVMPLLGRTERPATLRVRGDETEKAVAVALSKAWENGYNSVRLVFPDGREHYVFRDPAQLRSPNAKFDPAKRNSSDLLANLNPPAGRVETG